MQKSSSLLTFLLLTTVVACGRTPEEELVRLKRPQPIRCIALGQYNYHCTDGAQMLWSCGNINSDAECIVIRSPLSNEVGQ